MIARKQPTGLSLTEVILIASIKVTASPSLNILIKRGTLVTYSSNYKAFQAHCAQLFIVTCFPDESTSSRTQRMAAAPSPHPAHPPEAQQHFQPHCALLQNQASPASK